MALITTMVEPFIHMRRTENHDPLDGERILSGLRCTMMEFKLTALNEVNRDRIRSRV